MLGGWVGVQCAPSASAFAHFARSLTVCQFVFVTRYAWLFLFFCVCLGIFFFLRFLCFSCFMCFCSCLSARLFRRGICVLCVYMCRQWWQTCITFSGLVIYSDICGVLLNILRALCVL